MITPFRLSAAIGILLIIIAFFVQVSIVLPMMGVGLTLASLVMDLIYSLRSESDKIDKIHSEVKSAMDSALKNQERLINQLDIRMNRIESDRLYK